MALQDVTTTISDGLLASQSEQGDGVHVKIGASSIVSDTPIVITGRMSAAKIRSLLGYSPLADAVMDSVAWGAARVLCLPVAASTAGTLGNVTKIGTGNGSCTVDGSPYNTFGIAIRITGTGGLNTATFQYSIDGGATYSDDLTMSVNGVFAIPDTGVTLTFAKGEPAEKSFVVGDTYTLTTTAPAMNNNDILTAITKLRYISDPFEFVHVVGGTATALWVAVSTAQRELYQTYHKPVFFVLEAQGTSEQALENYVAGLETAKRSISNTDIQVVAARALYTRMDGRTVEGNAAGIVCGLYAKAPVQRSVGRTSEFALNEDKVLELRPAGIEPYLERLDAAQYLTLRRYDGLSGYYVTNARMMSPSGSDYKYAEHVRVRNKIIRATRKQALLQLQSDIDTANLPVAFAAIQAFIQTPLDHMIAAGEISAAAITIPPDQDILTTETLQITIRYVPIGYVRAMEIDLGVTKSIS